MKSSFAAVLVAAAGVSASWADNVTYTTEVVTALTTYCPEATVLTHAGSTYTISEVRLNTELGLGCTAGLLYGRGHSLFLTLILNTASLSSGRFTHKNKGFPPK